MKKKSEKYYKVGEVAEMLGVHEDTLRNWDAHGQVVADRVGTRRDRRYTAEHIKKIREMGLVSNLARRQPNGSGRDYSGYTKEQLIKELELLKEQKKFGLVWEEKTEEVVDLCKTKAPILKPVPKMSVKGGGDEQRHILIEGDNYHSLQVLNYTHKGKIDVIYIDPPYNTGAKNWKYNNDYVEKEDAFRHSKWLSMMDQRLRLARSLLKDDGVLICAIDDNEHANVVLLLRNTFPNHRVDSITIVHNPRGVQGKNFSYIHEYAVFVIPENKKVIGDKILEEKDVRISNLRNWGGESLRIDAKNCFYPIVIFDDKIVDFGDVALDDFHPKSANEKQKDGSIYVWPIDEGGVERKWRYARQSVEGVKDILSVERSRKGDMQIMITKGYGTYKTVWDEKKYDANIYGTKLLREILPAVDFDFPKSLHNVYDCVFAVVKDLPNSIILDFFAGSGTTGHAVMDLNREDGGSRQFILCTNNENNNGNGHGGVAESVCQPRIKKVMGGYRKNGDGEKVEGLGGGLEYLKTELVDVENVSDVSDKKRLKFTHEAGHVIALKENAFTELEKNGWYQIFSNDNNKIVGIYFRENLDKLEDLEQKILDKEEVKLYIFSHGSSDDWKNDYAEYENVVVEDIPEPILRVYKSLNS